MLPDVARHEAGHAIFMLMDEPEGLRAVGIATGDSLRGRTLGRKPYVAETIALLPLAERAASAARGIADFMSGELCEPIEADDVGTRDWTDSFLGFYQKPEPGERGPVDDAVLVHAIAATVPERPDLVYEVAEATSALLRRKDVWPAIEELSRALQERHVLCGSEVRARFERLPRLTTLSSPWRELYFARGGEVRA